MHLNLYLFQYPKRHESVRNSREGLPPNSWKIALLFYLSVCDSGSELTTDLGVGGSNPSGRAIQISNYAPQVRSSFQSILCFQASFFQAVAASKKFQMMAAAEVNSNPPSSPFFQNFARGGILLCGFLTPL